MNERTLMRTSGFASLKAHLSVAVGELTSLLMGSTGRAAAE